MSPAGRPKGEYRRAQPEGTPVSAATRRHRLDIDALWQIQRIGTPALSPDGRHAVCTVTSGSMEKNQSTVSLWLLPTDRAAPRRLTSAGDKDGQPAWSPRGDRIAFIARREQQGLKDATPQLYLIAPDGGEAQRCSDFGPGIESFRWLPDARGVIFAAWVWPDARGVRAQQRRHKAFTDRKESGYATSEAFYRHWDHHVPMGRVLHLLRLDLRSGRIEDLFEGTGLELPRMASGTEHYDVHPRGTHLAFVHDPAREPMQGNRLALVEMELATRKVRPLVDDVGWDLGAPSYSADGHRVAALAANVGHKHDALSQPVIVRRGRRWQPPPPDLHRHVDPPLRWSEDGSALLFMAEERGRRHLWRHALSGGNTEPILEGGWVQGFDLAGGVCVAAMDRATHPVQLLVQRAGRPLRRIERFNDALLRRVSLGQVREVQVTGAQGEPVQMWLTFPPGFAAHRRHPVNHVIHGGPFAAAGDTWGYRWNPHVLASRGHVVAQVNYHGSSGFGFGFRDSIVGHQGQLELQDIEAASDWLLEQHWADRQRLTATGGSYGGFLVAWMNGHVPAGRYRAYVCHAGVFDRVATFSADSYAERPKDLAALYWEDLPRVLAQSPMASAATMDTPTLVIHGALDYRVPDCNALAYYNTLKARGVAARLLWFADENHWILKPRNSRMWTQELLDWLEQHAPARPRRGGRGVRAASRR